MRLGIDSAPRPACRAQDLHAWAQQVVQLRNGTFVMVFPAVGRNSTEGVARGGVGVASATHPAGPFMQASADRLPGTVGADDPTIFIDDITGGSGEEQTVLCVKLAIQGIIYITTKASQNQRLNNFPPTQTCSHVHTN